MSTCNATFQAKAVAQVNTITPANVGIGNTFTVTIAEKDITFTATAGTVANVTAGLVALLNASTIPEFAEITWTDSTTHITATADTAGLPFIQTSSAAGGTATLTTATSTACTGPTFWDDADNWSGAVPIDGDEVNVNLDLGSFRDGLAQSSVQPASLNIYSSSQTSNGIGRPRVNEGGYNEYRATALAIGPVETVIDAEGALVNLNYGTDPNTTEVRKAGQSNVTGVPAVLLQGSNVANAIDVVSGIVGLAFNEGETYVAATVRNGPGGEVHGGAGATGTTIENSGTMVWKGAFTNFTNKAGTADIQGEQSAAIIEAEEGTVFGKFSGTIADGTAGPGVFDFSADMTPRTFTDFMLKPGGAIIDPHQTVTVTNQIALDTDVRELRAA